MRTFESATGRDNSSPSRSRGDGNGDGAGRRVAPCVLALATPTYATCVYASLVYTYNDERASGGAEGMSPPPSPAAAETTGAKIGANCGIGVRFSCSLVDNRGYSRQTSLPKRVLPPSVSFPSLPFPSHHSSRLFLSLSTFVTVKRIGFLTAPVFAISIAILLLQCMILHFDSDTKQILFASLRLCSIYFFSVFILSPLHCR